MTLQQIKDSLPKWIYLESGRGVWQSGDIFLGSMCEVPSDYYGTKIDAKSIRPIPSEVLENQAFWVLYNKLATVAPDAGNGTEIELWFNPDLKERGISPQIEFRNTKGHFFGHCRRFESEEKALGAIPLLGGEQNIIKHLLAGDLYSAWLGEQLR